MTLLQDERAALNPVPARLCCGSRLCALPWLFAASHPFSQAAEVRGSAEGQHLESRAPGSLGSGMQLMLMLLAPLPRCCPRAVAGGGESCAGGSSAAQLVTGHVPACGPSHPKAFHTSEQGVRAVGAAGRKAQGAALFQLRCDKSCFSAVCPSAFNSKGDVQGAGGACRG